MWSINSHDSTSQTMQHAGTAHHPYPATNNGFYSGKPNLQVCEDTQPRTFRVSSHCSGITLRTLSPQSLHYHWNYVTSAFQQPVLADSHVNQWWDPYFRLMPVFVEHTHQIASTCSTPYLFWRVALKWRYNNHIFDVSLNSSWLLQVGGWSYICKISILVIWQR